ncbi:unnamed protein product [Protopolystoma xenopodis]|uniref:Uncharacterized protein n=1 Tax=Protopolystoma xenopodis TaxID=117903 RepID=A0A448X4C4_9PLAT|nr:unnamed protein product [Protopolystoma xenopodis]
MTTQNPSSSTTASNPLQTRFVTDPYTYCQSVPPRAEPESVSLTSSSGSEHVPPLCLPASYALTSGSPGLNPANPLIPPNPVKVAALSSRPKLSGSLGSLSVSISMLSEATIGSPAPSSSEDDEVDEERTDASSLFASSDVTVLRILRPLNADDDNECAADSVSVVTMSESPKKVVVATGPLQKTLESMNGKRLSHLTPNCGTIDSEIEQTYAELLFSTASSPPNDAHVLEKVKEKEDSKIGISQLHGLPLYECVNLAPLEPSILQMIQDKKDFGNIYLADANTGQSMPERKDGVCLFPLYEHHTHCLQTSKQTDQPSYTGFALTRPAVSAVQEGISSYVSTTSIGTSAGLIFSAAPTEDATNLRSGSPTSTTYESILDVRFLFI